MKYISHLVVKGVIGGLIAILLGIGIGISNYQEPLQVSAATPIGNYYGSQVYCSSDVVKVIRRSSARSLESYCTNAYYVWTKREGSSCTRFITRGKAWIYSFGMQFDVSNTLSLGRCGSV